MTTTPFPRRRLLTLSAASFLAGTPLAAHGERYHKQRAQRLTGIPCYNYQWGSRSISATSSARAILLEENLGRLARELFENRAQLELLIQALKSTQPVMEEVQPLEPTPAAELSPPQSSARRPRVLRGQNAGAREFSRSTDTDNDLTMANRLETRMANNDPIRPANNLRVFQLDRAQLAVDHCRVSDVAVQLHRNGCWVLSLRADQNPRMESELDEPYIYRPRLHLKRNEFHIHMRCYGLLNTISAPREFQAGRPILADLHPVKFWVQRMEPRHLRIACSDRRVLQHYERISLMEIEFFYR